MHDLVAHIDWCTELGKRPLDDFDGSIDTCTKAARLCQYDFIERFYFGHSTPISRTSKVTGCPANGWLKSKRTAVALASITAPA